MKSIRIFSSLTVNEPHLSEKPTGDLGLDITVASADRPSLRNTVQSHSFKITPE